MRIYKKQTEKTLTFTVEDALLSPVSFAMLSGAGVVKGKDSEKVHFHQTSSAVLSVTTASDNKSISSVVIDLKDALGGEDTICDTAPIFISFMDGYGSFTGDIVDGWTTNLTTTVKSEVKKNDTTGEITSREHTISFTGNGVNEAFKDKGTTVMVDYYVLKKSSAVTELQIDAGHFGGYFYVEADTLFRRQEDGLDMPANITFPNVKIQSNFTFSMASTGDPSELMRLAA